MSSTVMLAAPAAPQARRKTQRRSQSYASSTPKPPPAQASEFKSYPTENPDVFIQPDFSPNAYMGKLLRSQIFPTDSERAQFQALQQDCLRQAASLDSLSVTIDHKVSELEAEIEKLRLRATNLREKSKDTYLTHRRLQALLAPIRILPPEIMSEIFRACLESTVSVRTDEALLSLCHVCSAWRAIALSTPQLWAALTITDLNMQSIGLSTEWFSRSGNLPLSLQLHMSNLYHPNGDLFVPPCQYNRLQNLEVGLQSGRQTAALFLLFSDVGLVNVERLSILDSIDPLHFNPRWFPAMPNLKKLLISGKVGFQGSFRYLPWNQLTHLSCTGYRIYAPDWCTLIRECTSLRHGTFTLTLDTEWFEFQENPAINIPSTLPHLLSLKIVFSAKGGWSILSGLSFPSLLSLTLGTKHPEYRRYEGRSLSHGMSLWHAPTFAQINVHSLETLVLFNVSVRKESLIAFLRTTPQLKSFTGDFPFDYRPLFKELSLLPDEAGDDENTPHVMPFLSNLSKLFIYPSPSTQGSHQRKVRLDVELLTHMVKTRWRPPCPSADDPNLPSGRGLTSVHVGILDEGTHRLKTQITTALRPFSRQGLIVRAEVEPKGYQLDLKVDW